MNAFGANLGFNTEVVCKSNLTGGNPALNLELELPKLTLPSGLPYRY